MIGQYMILEDRVAIALMLAKPPHDGLKRLDIFDTIADRPKCRALPPAFCEKVSAVLHHFIDKTQVYLQFVP